MPTARHWIILAALSGVLLLPTLGASRLWDRDEPRNAGCAAEMLARGDWVVPVFNNELRGHKPVLLYWCMMAVYSVLGVSEFSARLSCALFGIGTVLATYSIAARLFSARVGFWSGLILATTLMFGIAARAATPDAPLIFLVALALALVVRDYFPATGTALPLAPEQRFASPERFPLAFWGVLGLAALAKGPVGVVLPVAITGTFLLVRQRMLANAAAVQPVASERWKQSLRVFVRTTWHMRPVTGTLIVLLIAAPWYVWVGYRTNGAWLSEFFLEHNLNRARQPLEGHGGPLFYYLPALLIGFFPWSIFFGPTVLEAWRRRTTGTDAVGIAFCACWMVVWIGAFSVASTKLPSYITPCYPAMAILTALYLDRWTRCQEIVSSAWPWASLASLLVAGLGITIGLAWAAGQWLPGDEWLAAVGLVPIAAALYGIWQYRREHRQHVLYAMGLAACSLALLVFGVAAARVDRHRQNEQLLAAIENASPAARVGWLGVLEPSWVFYAERPFEQVVSRAGEIPEGRNATPDGQCPPQPPTAWDAFLDSGPEHYVITTLGQWRKLAPSAAGKYQVVRQVPYFLKQEQLVLIRALPERLATARRASQGTAVTNRE